MNYFEGIDVKFTVKNREIMKALQYKEKQHVLYLEQIVAFWLVFWEHVHL